MIDPLRLRRENERPVRADGEFVLYWMIAARRTRWNAALEHALALARELQKPLVVLEALRVGYRWASDRHHAFVLQGMADNQAAFAKAPVLYHPYVEPREGAGKGLLEALAARAAVVVTDRWPCFFLPRMVAAAAKRLPVRLESVDGVGLLPLASSGRAFPTAHSYRRFLQKTLREPLARVPLATPLARTRLPRLAALPRDVTRRWPAAAPELLAASPAALARLPIDHDVPPVELRGGPRSGEELLARFVDEHLERYGEDRNEPARAGTSGLSPFLHYGHVSVHDAFARVAAAEGWDPDELGEDTSGKREGWWGMRPAAESFLDQLVTWREVGHHFCAYTPHYDTLATLPHWAKTTLAEHAEDPREHVYGQKAFEEARTHDELWNAAQRQLRREGVIHNYLRMVWGKMILGWSTSPRAALNVLIELNNRWSIDGRDPNSYAGIFWTLGRFDRAWGPERPVYGKVRFMTTANTRRKLHVGPYLERYGSGGREPGQFD